MIRSIQQVGVIGAGLMGSGIALVTAHPAQRSVRIFDVEPQRAQEVVGRSRMLFPRTSMNPAEQVEARARLQPVRSLAELAAPGPPLDLVVEAVTEDLALKQSLLREMEALSGPHCIFASNTSALSIARLAEASSRPHTVVGMHYLSPVDRMALLEVVEQPQTAPEVTEACVALGRAQGKTAIVVRDSPGFYTSRILLAYLEEAVRLVWEGAPVEAVDLSLIRFGFPVGPLKLLDHVGLDVAGQVSAHLHQAFGERMAPSPLLSRLLADGRQGCKNGRGFYSWGGEKGAMESVAAFLPPPVPQPSMEEMAERATLRMLNEALRCLDEGVLRSADDGDMGAVLGLGFPAARGGPFRHAQSLGPGALRARLLQLASTLGPRFSPD